MKNFGHKTINPNKKVGVDKCAFVEIIAEAEMLHEVAGHLKIAKL